MPLETSGKFNSLASFGIQVAAPPTPTSVLSLPVPEIARLEAHGSLRLPLFSYNSSTIAPPLILFSSYASEITSLWVSTCYLYVQVHFSDTKRFLNFFRLISYVRFFNFLDLYVSCIKWTSYCMSLNSCSSIFLSMPLKLTGSYASLLLRSCSLVCFLLFPLLPSLLLLDFILYALICSSSAAPYNESSRLTQQYYVKIPI